MPLATVLGFGTVTEMARDNTARFSGFHRTATEKVEQDRMTVPQTT